MIVVLMALAAAGVLGRCSAPREPGSVEPGAARVENWPVVKESVAISIDAPAKLQQLNAAYAITSSGDRVPIRNFAIDITVFTDYECSVCRRLDSALSVVVRPWIVTRHVIHFPISEHANAMDAAQALECADADGQGLEMHAALFRAQRDLGKRLWGRIAADAFVEDTAQFIRCMNEERPGGRIRAGIALANRLGIRAPPAVIVNGWLVSPSSAERVDAAIRRIVDRKRTP